MTRAGADDDNDDKVHSDFDLAFEDGARVEGSWDETWTMRVIELGHLRLESGAILIGDPGVGAFDSEPLARRAPPGRYPVLLAVAEMPGDRRVAAAKLVLRDASVRRWEPAFFEGQDPAVKGLPCYGVDSGTGTFASAEAAAALTDEEASERLLEALDRGVPGIPELGACAHPDAPEGALCFTSGWGDGLYVSWWGIGDDGEATCLVTDFGLLIAAIYERIELPWPPPRGRVRHPLLGAMAARLWRPLLGRPRLQHRGKRLPRVRLIAPGEPARALPPKWRLDVAEYRAEEVPRGARVEVAYVVGERPARRVEVSAS